MPFVKLVVVPEMPRTRGDCVDGPRPCAFVHCRHHLASKVLPASRRLKVRALARGQDSCALDVADRGPHTLKEVGELLGVTRERVRQVEIGALVKLRGELAEIAGSDSAAHDAFFPDDRADAESMKVRLSHAEDLDVA